MNGLRTFAAEVAGLFVEDGWFALAIAVSVAVVVVLSLGGVLPPAARGGVLFAALATTLVAGVARSAR